MKLISIELENFRQFYGQQKIIFSGNSNSNVTIIHGENGSGKTALLNAFKWAFYGTTDFETGSDNLICERLLAEADNNDEMKMSVTVKFSHDEKDFSATRVEYFRKQEDMSYKKIGDSQFDLSWKADDGSYQKSSNSKTHINQILPPRMHPYFFFNGERIEKLSKIESSPDIQRAIKGMMGIEIIERAGRHLLKFVIPELKKDLKNLSTDEIKEVIEKEGFYTERLEEAKEKIDHYNNEKRHYRTELGEINNKLKEIGPIAELQNERESLTNEVKYIFENIKSVNKDKLECISKFGFLSFSKNIIGQASSILDDKRKKGELPAKIKVQFIDDLLEKNNCICDRALEQDSAAYKHVEGLKTTAVTDDVESAFINVSGDVKSMELSRLKLFKELNDYRVKIKEFEELKKNKHGRIDELTLKIGESELEDVVELEAKREGVREKLSSIDQEIGKWDDKLKENSEFVSEWSKKRKELDKKGGAANVVNNRLELAEETSRVILSLRDSLSETVRTELSTIVNDTFRSIIKKEYWAEIDSEYTLQIKKKIGEHVQNVIDKSTGESQVSSLSFIGGLVSLAKKRHGKSSEYYKGGIFPIVMDSPYGNLDEEYRAKIADYIPNLAEQVIIMVSNTQWRDEVENAVKGRISNEYTLMYHTPNKKNDTVTSSVIKGGKYEFTKIEEGYYE